MGYLFEFDPVNRVLRIRFEGELTEEILWEYYKDGKRHAPPDARGAIFDLSAVSSIQVKSAAMQELARMPPIIDDPLPRFIVASSDFAYGLARMFQSYGGKTRQALHVVRTITEAYSSLGITVEHFRALELSDQD
jgi:hypothetical protein